ncbi:putative homeodomain transcription factor [Sipha flava]|uniref:Homeodomain transcription factor n=2 Tax=Sipha flava TaxID=143950 RepID=A0A8B8GKT4_9HEMI|nr:putative homeodomain transcription factor [Sipha flava]
MGCNVQKIVTWYQKKIGTYDKQQWEKTIEQRILSGFTHVPKKNAKLKTDLIDVDLVRGSAFTKAKPKHGFFTVTRLAVIRLLFLPCYYRWYIHQTSWRLFLSLLCLYVLQLANILLFSYFTFVPAEEDLLSTVSLGEVLSPLIMMLVLSIVHSQIVSTTTISKKNFLKTPRSHSPRRAKRGHSTSSKIKNSTEMNVENLQTLVTADTNYLKRRNRNDDASKTHNVVWDTSPVKTRHWVLESSPDVNVSIVSEDFSSDLRLVNREEKKQLGGVDRMDVRPITSNSAHDDDGFESLNGNGSSDNPEEDILSGSTITSQMSESTSAEQSSSTPKHSNFTEKIESNVILVSKSTTDDGLATTKTVSGQKRCLRFKKTPISMKSSTVDLDRRLSAFQTSSCFKYAVNSESEDSEQEIENENPTCPKRLIVRRGHRLQLLQKTNSDDDEGDNVDSSSSRQTDEEGDVLSSNGGSACPLSMLTEGTTSAGEWIGLTTNTEEGSSTSDMDAEQTNLLSDNQDHPFLWEFETTPTVILSPSCAASDRVSCTMWEKKEVKKADLSVLDISSAIIARVEEIPEQMDYFYLGVFLSVIIALMPSAYRLLNSLTEDKPLPTLAITVNEPTEYMYKQYLSAFFIIINASFAPNGWERYIVLTTLIERFFLSLMFFFLLTVAERTYKQRFLYAKFFSHLTSFRRARKSKLPHFRLNKVRNIKTWLSIRSYLKKRGPQRSVDVIVSSSFYISSLFLAILSVELLKDTFSLSSEFHLESSAWCMVLGIYLLRFLTLGTKINKKYRNLSTLITEQINLYLQIEQKPNKKDDLMVANSVLKLAADLLKELESPFKIAGLSDNPYLFTLIKVVILSALSGVLSELLGFKLKLHKIKIK